MAREIKFRAWDKVDRRFLDENDNVPNFLSLVGCDSTGQFTPMYMSIEEAKVYDTDIILMQYTGLKDKNGEEIYEGDILRLVDSDIPRVVEFDKGCFVAVNRQGNAVSYRELWEQLLPEVIGNIYENQELLKEK